MPWFAAWSRRAFFFRRRFEDMRASFGRAGSCRPVHDSRGRRVLPIGRGRTHRTGQAMSSIAGQGAAATAVGAIPVNSHTSRGRWDRRRTRCPRPRPTGRGPPRAGGPRGRTAPGARPAPARCRAGRGSAPTGACGSSPTRPRHPIRGRAAGAAPGRSRRGPHACRARPGPRAHSCPRRWARPPPGVLYGSHARSATAAARTGCLLRTETRLKALMLIATQITAEISSSVRASRAAA